MVDHKVKCCIALYGWIDHKVKCCIAVYGWIAVCNL